MLFCCRRVACELPRAVLAARGGYMAPAYIGLAESRRRADFIYIKLLS